MMVGLTLIAVGAALAAWGWTRPGSAGGGPAPPAAAPDPAVTQRYFKDQAARLRLLGDWPDRIMENVRFELSIELTNTGTRTLVGNANPDVGYTGVGTYYTRTPEVDGGLLDAVSLTEPLAPGHRTVLHLDCLHGPPPGDGIYLVVRAISVHKFGSGFGFKWLTPPLYHPVVRVAGPPPRAAARWLRPFVAGSLAAAIVLVALLIGVSLRPTR
jgi:hypothetical protein